MPTTWKHFIAGRFAAPESDQYLDEYDPRTGEPCGKIARGGRGDIDLAVSAAHAAGAAWRNLKPLERGRVLTEISRIIRRNRERLIEAERRETGKPLRTAQAEIEVAAQYFEFYGGLAPALHGETIAMGPLYHSYTLREPYGVIGVILPWNAPLNQAGRAIAPALAAGNTVVAKPSEFTSVSLLELASAATAEAGLPPGVLNIVTGTGPEAGEPLVDNPLVRKVAFTGSVRAGRAIGRIAAERIIPLTLELGGKSPNIVFDDADLARAVAGAIAGFTVNAGQICVAGSRLLVQESVYDAFLAALTDRVRTIKADGAGDIGPMTTRAQYQKVREFYETARAEGATALIGGEAPEGGASGWFVPPTVYVGVRNDMRVAREEIFGPVAVLIPFRDEREAIAIANDTEYGLAAGIWTRDLSRAHRVAACLEAGQIFVNEYPSGSVETPFGGYKQSGYGREKGLEALHHYTQLKAVIVRL